MRTSFVACSILVMAAVWGAGALAKEVSEEKRIFAHYMGCYPADAGATHHHRGWDNAHLRHDSGKPEFERGGKIRNWPLVPPGRDRLPLVNSADLEIRRAMRGGIDGFAVDAWAGGDHSKAMLDALFEAAEAGEYDFSLTITLDPACLGNQHETKTEAAAAAVRYLLERHGNSPNLARRKGKPLVFGYLSGILAAAYAAETLNQTAGWENRNAYRDPEIRNTPEGWEHMLGVYDEIRRRVGQDIYFQFGIGSFFHGVNGTEGNLLEAAAYISKRLPAVGEFLADGEEHRNNSLAPIVTKNGAEWGEPIHYQYLNFGGRYWQPRGTEMLRERWAAARKNNATLIQFATWNDYNENTGLAPGYETRYAILDLNRHFIDWWKTGDEPKTSKDKIYLFWRKYPERAVVYPFREVGKPQNAVIEVATFFSAPALVQLPEQDLEYTAPAGLHFKQFPLRVGPVKAVVVRNGREVLSLSSPEPITDKPYREALGLQGISSEFQEHWNADFPDEPAFYAGEYADSDSDGLPDWYEMYWFHNRLLDWNVATSVEPDADPDRDGKTNFEEYQEQTDPTTAPPRYEPGFVWEAAVANSGSSVNPAPDSRGQKDVWHYLYSLANQDPSEKSDVDDRLLERSYPNGKFFVSSGIKTDGNPCVRRVNDGVWEFMSSKAIRSVSLGWKSPVDGEIAIKASVIAPDKTGKGAGGEIRVRHEKQVRLEEVFRSGHGGDLEVEHIPVRKGEFVYLDIQGRLHVDGITVKLQSASGPNVSSSRGE